MKQLFSRVMGFAKVVGSSFSDKAVEMLLDLGGIGADDDPGAEADETRDKQEIYTALGVFGRPRDPDTADPDLFAEVLAARVGDGLVPIGFRDPRILEWVNKGSSPPTTPKKGQTGIGGYGGAFLSFETIDQSGMPVNIAALYVPYARNGSGVPQKAHLITLDPTAGNESIGLVHGEGFAVLMSNLELMLRGGDQNTFLSMKPGTITANATNISLTGNVIVGKGTGVALPLLAGAASPPCTALWVYP